MKMQKEENNGFLTEYIEHMDQAELDFGRMALEVAEEITIKMKEKSLSKADLAKRLGTSRAYVTKVLTGDANLSLKTLAKVQNALEAKSDFYLNTDNTEDGISFRSAPSKNFVKNFEKNYEKTTPGQNNEDISIAA